MKKKIVALLLSVAASMNLYSQNEAAPDLQQINASAKNAYVSVETLDKLQQDLKYFDQHPEAVKNQQALLLETYRVICNGYSINNHFKQGLFVYEKYLSLKETFLVAEKTEAIAKLNHDIEDKQHKDVEELLNMQNEVNQLQLDNEYLVSKRKSFKNYFSLIILVLTVLFASLLLQTGLKLNKIKRDLKAGRERLKVIHRIATLGRLKTGIVFTINSIFTSLKNTTSESSIQIEHLNKLSGEKNNEQISLLKQIDSLLRLTDK